MWAQPIWVLSDLTFDLGPPDLGTADLGAFRCGYCEAGRARRDFFIGDPSISACCDARARCGGPIWPVLVKLGPPGANFVPADLSMLHVAMMHAHMWAKRVGLMRPKQSGPVCPGTDAGARCGRRSRAVLLRARYVRPMRPT